MNLEQAARAMYEAKRRGIVGEGFPTFIAGASWLSEYLLSDENVEKAARAMYATDHNNDGYTFDDDTDRGYWRTQARAALSAVLSEGESSDE